MRRTPWHAVSFVLVLGLGLVSCNSPNRSIQPSAASGFQVVVTASPNVLPADGTSQAIVQVKVFDTRGNLIDGATVSLAATKGTISTTPASAPVVSGVGSGGTSPGAGTGASTTATSGTTTRGLLTATFTAGKAPGTAIVTASVEDAVTTVLITLF